MFTFLKAFCGALYDDPKQGFGIIWVIIRAILSVLIGCLIYGLAELYALINKKNKK